MSDALAQLAAEFEQGFVVHDEVGLPNADYEGPRDMNRAPNGEPYATVTSDGWWESQSFPNGLWFGFAGHAVADWKHWAQEYAEGRGKNLYWREKPRWIEAEFLPIDQAAALNDAVLQNFQNIKIGFIYSRMLVSTMRPDGTEDSDAG